MTDLGETLRRERTRRGIDLEQIAEATRIRSGYLEALEQGELARLPGGTFARGYVRAYAEYVGLDPAAMLDAYTRLEEAQQREGKLGQQPDPLDGLREAIERRSAERRRRFGSVQAALAGLVLVVLAGAGGWFYLSGRSTPDRPAAALASAPEVPIPSLPVVESAPVTAPVQEAVAPRAETLPEPPPRPAPAAALAETELKIEDAGVGTRVAGRELQGRGEAFAQGSQVWFWTRVVGGRRGDRIRHVWLQDGRIVQSTNLEIGGSPWRTYSHKRLPRGTSGAWAAEARDAADRVLSRVEFRSAD